MERIREQRKETRFWIASTQAVCSKRWPTEGGQEAWPDPVSELMHVSRQWNESTAVSRTQSMWVYDLSCRSKVVNQAVMALEKFTDYMIAISSVYRHCIPMILAHLTFYPETHSFLAVSSPSRVKLPGPWFRSVFYRLCDKKVTVEEKVYPKIMHRFVLVFLHRLYHNMRSIVTPWRSIQLHFLLWQESRSLKCQQDPSQRCFFLFFCFFEWHTQSLVAYCG